MSSDDFGTWDMKPRRVVPEGLTRAEYRKQLKQRRKAEKKARGSSPAECRVVELGP